MPVYYSNSNNINNSIKEVKAIKIKHIVYTNNAYMILSDDIDELIDVTYEFLLHNKPKSGDYYVEYTLVGYKACMKAEEFEKNYKLKNNEVKENIPRKVIVKIKKFSLIEKPDLYGIIIVDTINKTINSKYLIKDLIREQVKYENGYNIFYNLNIITINYDDTFIIVPVYKYNNKLKKIYSDIITIDMVIDEAEKYIQNDYNNTVHDLTKPFSRLCKIPRDDLHKAYRYFNSSD